MKSSIKRIYVNRKIARPFSSDQALHVVMRSEVARGEFSLLRKENRVWLRQYLPKVARKFSVRLYGSSNNGNHLHLVVKAKGRTELANFLRVIAGGIARKVLRAEKGRGKGIRFWVSRPYSRIVTWGREFWNVMKYVERNVLEASGRLVYRVRDRRHDPATDWLWQRAYLNQLDLKRASAGS